MISSLGAMPRLRNFLWLCGAVSAQFTGWTDDQVNASICIWPQPRGLCSNTAISMNYYH